MNDLSIGDIVQLKSGGPVMTITELPHLGGVAEDPQEDHRCSWVDELGDVRHTRLNSCLLKVIEVFSDAEYDIVPGSVVAFNSSHFSDRGSKAFDALMVCRRVQNSRCTLVYFHPNSEFKYIHDIPKAALALAE